MVGALALFIAGMLYFGRKPDLPARLIGWLAWYAGTSPSGA
jgi:hypothetical protein